MKAVAYSVKDAEKEFLAKANQKKHNITLISNSLCPETTIFAEGKEAVVIFTADDISAPAIKRLADLGARHIIIISQARNTGHINAEVAAQYRITIANIPAYSPQSLLTKKTMQEIADQIIKNLDEWQKCKY